jgi:hypothetical protein
MPTQLRYSAPHNRHPPAEDPTPFDLRDIQATRRASEQKALKQAAAFLKMHKHKGITFNPAENGFVFSKDQIEAHSQHLMRLQRSRRPQSGRQRNVYRGSTRCVSAVGVALGPVGAK